MTKFSSLRILNITLKFINQRIPLTQILQIFLIQLRSKPSCLIRNILTRIQNLRSNHRTPHTHLMNWKIILMQKPIQLKKSIMNNKPSIFSIQLRQKSHTLRRSHNPNVPILKRKLHQSNKGIRVPCVQRTLTPTI